MELAEPRIPKGVRNGQMISHGDDSTILAIFSDDYVKNDYRSEQEGRVILDHFYKISLQYPGNNLSDFAYRFRTDDIKNNQWVERFPRQWEAFMAQREQVVEGMPIDVWAPLDKRRILELKAMHIHTVEQIATLTDITGPNMGLDWRKLRDMAQATITPAVGAAEISRLNRENDDKENRIQALENQLADLARAKTTTVDITPVTSQDTETPKRRGRPPRQGTTEAA